MRIMICDDEEMQLALIGCCVSEYINNRRLDIDVKKFQNPTDLLEYEKKNGSSEIYLFDIVMDNMSGLELGRRIREYNERAVIIYLTTAPEFSLDAFGVHAFSYLVKPFEKEKLFSELDKCFTLHIPPQRKETVITVKTSNGMVPVSTSKINAVEYLDHRLIYILTNGEKIEGITQKIAFDIQAEGLLNLGIFIKAANGYIVNMDNIHSVTARGFKMKNGAEFPVTRKYAAARDKFLKRKLGGQK